MATNALQSPAYDILAVVHDDHQRLDALFARYAEAADGAAKRAVVEALYRELTPHAQAEEEILYAAIAAAGGDEDMVEAAHAEHGAARKTLASILAASPDDPTYDIKVRLLQKEIQHHVREEETELFEAARDAGLDLAMLGERFAARKRELAEDVERQLTGATEA